MPIDEQRDLCEQGIYVLDLSFFRASTIYRPVHDAVLAQRMNRSVSGVVQPRVDGWLTYYKFAWWNLTCFFDQVLVHDLDAELLSDPRPFAKKYALTPLVLESETAARHWEGGRTSLMLIRTSREVFLDLVQKALTGDYMVYTNTDQEVIENYFRLGPPRFLRHQVYFSSHRALLLPHLWIEVPYIHGAMKSRSNAADAGGFCNRSVDGFFFQVPPTPKLSDSRVRSAAKDAGAAASVHVRPRLVKKGADPRACECFVSYS